MSTARVIRWLHLSDLHCPSGMDRAWEDAARLTLDRLEAVLREQGPIDLVVVSGDVARTGHPREYDRASALFDEIRRRFAHGRTDPIILAVPGNHDMQWDARGTSQVADATVEQAFAHWTAWWNDQVSSLPPGVKVYPGGSPGDFSATLTFEDRDLRFGVVAINTATGQDNEGLPPHLDERLRAVGGQLPEWVGYHHAAVFVSHHPPTRVEGPAVFWREVARAGFVVAHCGHLHRFDARRVFKTRRGTVLARAMSFAGYEPHGGAGFHMLRPSGGVVGEINFDPPERALLRVWEFELSARSGPWLEPVVREEVAREPRVQQLPESLPEPLARATPRVEDETLLEPTREQVEVLLRQVLPDEADFRSFTLAEMPAEHRRLPYDATREVRTRALLDRVEPGDVYEALRRYLPDTTAARAKALRVASRG